MKVMDTFTSLSVIVIISSLLSLLAIAGRQPLIVAYILGGVSIGPWGLGLVSRLEEIEGLAHLGITLLLFIAGLELEPGRFILRVRKAFPFVLSACLANAAAVGFLSFLIGYGVYESCWVGVALMFSSTLLFIKLMPKESFSQKETNAFCLSVLIIEDLIAVFILMGVSLYSDPNQGVWHWLLIPLLGVLGLAVTFYGERYLVRPAMLSLTCRYRESHILSAFAWCLAIAVLFKKMGFSHEMGAFLAGMSLAQNPSTKQIEEGLRFLRDFFLILFFVVLGVEIDLLLTKTLLFPMLLVTTAIILTKPFILNFFFLRCGIKKKSAKESSSRLGQSSEFGLIVSYTAEKQGVISLEVSQFIQLVVIFTIIFSCTRLFYTYPIRGEKVTSSKAGGR